MPRLTGPLFSLDARQTLAKTIVYSAWKGLNYARLRVIPYNPKSAAQLGVRTTLTYGVQYWRDGTVSAADQIAWNGYATGLNESGFTAICGTSFRITTMKQPKISSSSVSLRLDKIL